MAVRHVYPGHVSARSMVLGGDQSSGFSHRSPERDALTRRYYTTARIRGTCRAATALGTDTVLGRGNRHISSGLMEWWAKGGRIQWIAQTCRELAPHTRGIANPVQAGQGTC
jgi:hypothetical protein